MPPQVDPVADPYELNSGKDPSPRSFAAERVQRRWRSLGLRNSGYLAFGVRSDDPGQRYFFWECTYASMIASLKKSSPPPR